ncbi:MAG: hypothetical protein JXA03_14805 [Bacteroidales bacterium]|nr:hypothetical protein [Bacteroidales bacterium]
MKKISNPFILLYIFTLSLIMFSCQKEVEVEIDPGYLSVKNNSEITYDIFIRNTDKNSSEFLAGKVTGYGSADIPLEYGYTYEIRAVEDNPQGEPDTHNRTLLVKPHIELKWSLPNKQIRN